jgi:hypothetical protein
MKRQSAIQLALTIAALIIAGGCAADRNVTPHAALLAAADISIAPSDVGPADAVVIRTPHYAIHTTLVDADTRLALARVMEGAYELYEQIAPAAASETPMPCYVFHRRVDWAEFTQRTAGADAAIYLQISRGGYSVGDRFAVYRATPEATYMVMAHEGWHQYVGRHFAQRLPPVLEEGIACLFESVYVENGVPSWDARRNVNREGALRWAVQSGTLRPLDQLITMHAGQVVELPSEQVELFYGQAWGLARLLRDGENGRYSKSLRRMLTDAAAGRLAVPGGSAGGRYLPGSARPLLEHYLGQDLPTLQVAYDAYIRSLVKE